MDEKTDGKMDSGGARRQPLMAKRWRAEGRMMLQDAAFPTAAGVFGLVRFKSSFQKSHSCYISKDSV